MADMPSGDIGDAPLEEFIDPQSGIADILNRMTATAQNSRPAPLETVQNANRPVPTNRASMGMSPDDFIRMLMEGQSDATGPMDLRAMYR